MDNHAFYPDDGIGKSSTSNKKLLVQARKKFKISYESLLWYSFVFVTVLCTVDRFVGTGDATLKRSGG